MQIKLLVEAGDMKPGPALSQKLGPLGLNIGKIIAKINEATSSFKGIKIPVTLNIDSKTKDFDVTVSTPPTAELFKKELGFKKGSQQPDKIKVANVSFEIIIKIAKIKQKDMFTNSLKETVKTVIGSCTSIGILVESKEPKDVIQEINQGKYDDLINSGAEEASKEKLDKLAEDFEQVQKGQENLIKELEKKAEEKTEAPAEAPSDEKSDEKKV